jgi:hypothetical protein
MAETKLTCRICGGEGYLDTNQGRFPCRCNWQDPRGEQPTNREMEMVLVGYENMGPEGDYPAAVEHLCQLLRAALTQPETPDHG